MKVISVDLAYLDYRDIGVAVLDGVDTATRVSFIVPRVAGTPTAGVLAEFSSGVARAVDPPIASEEEGDRV